MRDLGDQKRLNHLCLSHQNNGQNANQQGEENTLQISSRKKSGFSVKRAGHSWAWLENDPVRTCPWVGRDTDGGLTGHVSRSLQAQPRARESSGHLTGCPVFTGHGEPASQALLASSMLPRHGPARGSPMSHQASSMQGLF